MCVLVGDGIRCADASHKENHKPQTHPHPQVSKAHLSPAGRARSQGLEALLANPLLERFAQNLHLLVHPQTRWQGIVRQLHIMAGESRPPPIQKV